VFRKPIASRHFLCLDKKKPNRHPELLNEPVNNFSDSGTKYPRRERTVREKLDENFFYLGSHIKQIQNYNWKK